MSRHPVFSVVLAAAAVVIHAQAPKPERDWSTHGHDAGAQRYSPLKQINTSNVSNLQLVWTYDTPAAVPAVIGSRRWPAEDRKRGTAAEGGTGARRWASEGVPSRPRRGNRRRRRSWSTA